MNWKIFAILAGLGGLALALRPRTASAAGFASDFPAARLAELGANAQAIQVGRWAWDEWTRAGLDPRAKIGLVAIGWHETRLKPLRSAAGLRDDELGGSW